MCVWNHKNVADAPESLMLFSNDDGDGGGGPTPDMLDKVCATKPDREANARQCGRITSFIDRHIGREPIPPGPGADDGGLNLYEDSRLNGTRAA